MPDPQAPQTVPMISPDGTSGDIPVANLNAARQAGFKVAVTMQSPDGKNGYIPAERSQEAAAKGFKMVPMSIPDEAKPHFWDALTNPVGSGAHEQGVLGGIEQVGGQAIKAMAAPVMHPIDTLAGAGKTLATAIHYGTGIPIPDSLNVAPQAIEGVKHDYAQGGVPLAAENVAGQALGAVEGGRAMAPVVGVAAKAAPAVDLAQRVKQYMKPTSAASIVPRAEFAARRLADAVIPAGQDAPNFIKSAQQEVPNILDYAKRTGNPLNTQLEFSKAAQGYAQEVRQLYEKDVLGPSETKLVRTTGTGFGRRMSEGPDTQATLGEIDQRITAINQQLDKPALNADDARRALATKKELQNEASGLRDILHRNLSETSGLAPEEIANLRQRVGRSYELANDTDAAVTKRMLAAGKSDQGPLHLSQIPTTLLNKASGGVVANADRAFQGAIRNFPGESQALPKIAPPAIDPLAAQGPSRLEQLLTVARQKQERFKYMNP